MPRKSPPIDVEYFAKRYLAGESLEALAMEHHIGQARLRWAFYRARIPLRNRSEAAKVRLVQAGPEGRKALTVAANKASRGRTISGEEMQKRAVTRAITDERTKRKTGSFENNLLVMLRLEGLHPIPQQAVMGYNLDLGLDPIAVEVHVAANNPLTDRKKRQRIKKLIEAGWLVVYVWITAAHPPRKKAAEHIAALFKQAHRNPTLRGQYRVIRGSGEDATVCRDLD